MIFYEKKVRTPKNTDISITINKSITFTGNQIRERQEK